MDATLPTSDWRVEVFFDGDCPLSLREIKLLRWLARKPRYPRLTYLNPALILTKNLSENREPLWR